MKNFPTLTRAKLSTVGDSGWVAFYLVVQEFVSLMVLSDVALLLKNISGNFHYGSLVAMHALHCTPGDFFGRLLCVLYIQLKR